LQSGNIYKESIIWLEIKNQFLKWNIPAFKVKYKLHQSSVPRKAQVLNSCLMVCILTYRLDEDDKNEEVILNIEQQDIMDTHLNNKEEISTTITLSDVKNILNIIDMACQRGIFQAKSMVDVGVLYNKLNNIIEVSEKEKGDEKV
jgi:hypothetical protein